MYQVHLHIEHDKQNRRFNNIRVLYKYRKYEHDTLHNNESYCSSDVSDQ